MLTQSLVDQVGKKADHQDLKATDKGEDNGHEKTPAENDAIDVKPKAYFKENETGREKDFHGVDIHDRAANELEKIDGIPDGFDL